MPKRSRAIARISPAALAAIFERGQAVTVVDARDPEDFFSSPLTILGAIAIPLDQIRSHLGRLTTGEPIVVFDACPGNRTSERVARQIRTLGFDDVRVLEGGFIAWEGLELPTMLH